MPHDRIDPITLEVIRHASIAAAEEMKTNLMRTAHNPIIYEVLDFSCGVFDHRGNMIAQADGLPIFLGNLAAAIRVVIDDIGLENFRPGDLYLINDPYATGTHVNDLTTVNPVFDDDGEIIAFTSARAHWLDIGAKDPGGSIDSTDVVQEGLWFRSVQLYEEGELNESIWRIIQYNVPLYPEHVGRPSGPGGGLAHRRKNAFRKSSDGTAEPPSERPSMSFLSRANRERGLRFVP